MFRFILLFGVLVLVELTLFQKTHYYSCLLQQPFTQRVTPFGVHFGIFHFAELLRALKCSITQIK